jgi:hypothetical protein
MPAATILQVLEVVLEIDLLGDGHTVLRDRGRAPALLENDVATLRSERHPNRIGKGVDTPKQSLPGVLVKTNLLR